jgi:nitroreductase
MDVMEAITGRRSVRKYSLDPISEEELRQILEAGRWAPSRGNSQPWTFIVMKDDQVRKDVAAVISTGKFLAEAPVGVAVVVNPESSKHPEQEGAAATQNMLLAANGLGLGTCWISVHGTDWEEAVQRMLGVPDGEWVISVISIGHAAENPEKGRKELDQIAFTDKYGHS